MDTWGVFSDEGLVAECGSEAEARQLAARMLADGDRWAHAGVVCPDHEEEEAEHCEECNAEEAD
jgi:hypothetical protein